MTGAAARLPGRLADVPRAPLLHGPTPLHPWRALTESCAGPRILAKRDDLAPLLLGGNKLRKLELLLGAALAEGADTVVTYGAAQSNHCAQTAAAARRHGLEPVLCLRGRGDEPVTGNLLLDRMLGADVRFDPGPHDAIARRAWLGRVADELRAAGRRPYVAPYGGSSPPGALGFALAGRELDDQLRAAGERPAAVVVTSSSGGTQAGLVVARAAGWLGATVVGVSVDEPAAALTDLVNDLAVRTARSYGLPVPRRDLVEVTDAYRGDGYGVPSAAGEEAAMLLLRSEGVLTDAVYTAKGLSGLVGLVRAGRWGAGDAVVFWHTGGLPAVFA